MSKDAAKYGGGFLQTEQGRFWIYPVVGFYDVTTHELLPFSGFVLKVVDTNNGEFRATPNVQVYNTNTKCIEHVCGIGSDIHESIADAISMFMVEAQKQLQNKSGQELDDADFIWLNWQPYVQLSMPPTG